MSSLSSLQQSIVLNPLVRRLLGRSLSRELLHRFNPRISRYAHLEHNVRLLCYPEKIIIEAGATIGFNCELHAWGEIFIGKNVIISPQTVILTGSHNVETEEYGELIKPVYIEDYAWIAYRSMILPGVRIGKGAVVGAGSVVTKDVEPWSIVAGNPARHLKWRGMKDLHYIPASWHIQNYPQELVQQ
jgi:acetyltransferase-like isoleucine patch superfamily enzyme